MKNAIVKLDEVLLDEELYPRRKESWVTAYGYSQAMKAGSKFPPIVVANHKGKKYLIDGWHRMQAYRKNGVEYADAEVFKAKDRTEMYIEAVRRNATHGRPFTFQERVGIIDKLGKMNVSNETISKIVGIQIEKMESIKIERITNTVTGKTVILKSPMKHFSGHVIQNGEAEVQEQITGVRSQVQLIDMVTNMLEEGAFDMDNPAVVKCLERLSDMLDTKLKITA